MCRQELSHKQHKTKKTHREVYNISRTLVGNKIVDHADVVGASPVGATPTTKFHPTFHHGCNQLSKLGLRLIRVSKRGKKTTPANHRMCMFHHDVIKWKHCPHYWPFVRGIHRSRVNSPHKGQWRGAFMFSLICAWMNGWVNSHDLRRHRAHYDVT